jgi:hypothetical protein
VPTLAHKLRLVDYFVLAFGVMVGTAWLVVMDNLLQPGGRMGALLGFTMGALMLLPIAYVYGELMKGYPGCRGRGCFVYTPCASPKLRPAVKSTVCTTSSIRKCAMTVLYLPLSPPLVGTNPQTFSITARLASGESRTSPAARCIQASKPAAQTDRR